MSAAPFNTKNGKRYSVTRTNAGGGKFCKICKDTGKSLAEYTNHYVRENPDPNSKVVCPTLIAAVCRYCKNGGHTVKHCPKVQAKNKINHKKNSHIISKSYCNETTDSKKVKETDNFHSAFSVLEHDDSSDEEDELEDTVVSVSPPSPNINSCNVVSYASILKNGVPPPPQSKKETLVSQVDSLIPTKLDFSEETEIDNVVTLFDITGKWTDDEDTDDCDILDFVTSRPDYKEKDHPLYHYNCWLLNNSIDKYTDGYTKNIRITRDAFYALFNQWDNEYFENNDANNVLKNTMQTNDSTNSNARITGIMSRFTN